MTLYLPGMLMPKAGGPEGGPNSAKMPDYMNVLGVIALHDAR